MPVSKAIVLASHLDLSTTTGEVRELEINIFINREKKR